MKDFKFNQKNWEFALNITDAYAGEDLDLVLRSVQTTSLFHSQYGAVVIPTVKSTVNYHYVTTDAELHAYESCPSPVDNIDVTPGSISVCEFQIGPITMNNNSLVDTFRQRKLAQGINSEAVTDDTILFDIIEEVVVDAAVTQWDDIILNGQSGYGTGHLSLCNGLRYRWGVETGIKEVRTVDVDLNDLTAANIINAFDDVLTAANDKLQFNPNPSKTLKFGVSPKIARLWRQYLSTGGGAGRYFNYDPTKKAPLMYNEMEIVPLFYLPENEMFLSYPDNFALYYDSESEVSQFLVGNKMSPLTNFCNQTVAMMAFRGVVDYSFGDDIVWYRPA